MKSEQSRTFATSLKEDVVDSLRNMLKKEVVEAKKYLNVGKKTDLDMKIILEKIETVPWIYWKLCLYYWLDKKEVYNVEPRDRRSTEK